MKQANLKGRRASVGIHRSSKAVLEVQRSFLYCRHLLISNTFQLNILLTVHSEKNDISKHLIVKQQKRWHERGKISPDFLPEAASRLVVNTWRWFCRFFQVSTTDIRKNVKGFISFSYFSFQLFISLFRQYLILAMLFYFSNSWKNTLSMTASWFVCDVSNSVRDTR